MGTAFTPSNRGGSGPPLVCLHGFTDTWRAWELVLPELERHHDVLAPTPLGHAGAPPLAGKASAALLADGVERTMDGVGVRTAHLVGNSLGGYIAPLLAARGRARSVVALAPAGGWAEDDPSREETLGRFVAMQEQLRATAPHVEAILASAEGRRRATRLITTRFAHIPTALVAHQMRGVVGCTALRPLVESAIREGYPMDPERITCPVRVVWGTDDGILAWPSAAARGLGRAGGRRALPAARRAARDGPADRRLHRTPKGRGRQRRARAMRSPSRTSYGNLTEPP